MPRCVFINPAVVSGRMGNVSGIRDGVGARCLMHVPRTIADPLGKMYNEGEQKMMVVEGGRACGGFQIACHPTMQHVS